MEASKNNVTKATEKAEDLGIFGIPIDDVELQRINERVAEEIEYERSRLAIEERRGQTVSDQGRRDRLKDHITANAAAVESPHRYYFVREPGL